jgi:hypothetical protein
MNRSPFQQQIQWSIEGLMKKRLLMAILAGLCSLARISSAYAQSETTAVNLSSVYNVTSGIVTDGTSFSGGGLDNDGNAYSSNALGVTFSYAGTNMVLGPANSADAVSNATVPLTAGAYSSLNILAVGVNGSQTSQTFTLTYSDGTRTTFTQNLSDWAFPQNYSGETVVATASYRDQAGGTEDTGTAVHLYGYTFTLNSSKTVSKITLPSNRNVVVLAMTLVGTNSPGIIGDCGMDENGAGTGQVDYVEVYSSQYARWCVDTTYWAANQQSISNFYSYYDGAVAQLISLFNVQPSLPIVVEVTTPTGGACDCGPKFGEQQSVVITGDAYSNTFNNPQNNQAVPGFWGYLLTLHETINAFTGSVSGGWPTDWWADHRSPFPNAMDEQVMKYIGTEQNNQTLLNAAQAQHERFADPGISGYDSEVAMFDNFFNQYGGFKAYSKFFQLVEKDKLSWPSVSQDSSYTGDNDYSALLSEYVAAYLSMAFNTTSDLTSTFASAGVGTLDTTEPSYTLNSSAVLGVGNAHCSISAASGAGVNVNSQLSQLQSGNYQKAIASGGTQAACPSECSWSGGKCVAKW